jgi:hypothetical protein
VVSLFECGQATVKAAIIQVVAIAVNVSGGSEYAQMLFASPGLVASDDVMMCLNAMTHILSRLSDDEKWEMPDEVEQGSEMIDWLKVLMDESDDREAAERSHLVLELLLAE